VLVIAHEPHGLDAYDDVLTLSAGGLAVLSARPGER
jgi:hypothetical protein